MNIYSLRVLSSLMRATERQIASILAERDAETPHGVLSYSGAYQALRRHICRPDLAVLSLQRWRDNTVVTDRTRSFRTNAYANLEWCATTVLPRIVRIVEFLEGDWRRSGKPMEIAGEQYTGGFHVLVDWIDGTQRLVYFLGPKWPRKRIRNMLVLLQMKAALVYGRLPQSVVIVDIPRREVIELGELDPADQGVAVETAQWLRAYLRRRRAS